MNVNMHSGGISLNIMIIISSGSMIIVKCQNFVLENFDSIWSNMTLRLLPVIVSSCHLHSQYKRAAVGLRGVVSGRNDFQFQPTQTVQLLHTAIGVKADLPFPIDSVKVDNCTTEDLSPVQLKSLLKAIDESKSAVNSIKAPAERLPLSSVSCSKLCKVV